MARIRSHGAHGREQYIEEATDALRQAGSRVTQPRLAVLACLADARRALSPRDVVVALKHKRHGVDVDQATVYRILETLSGLGLIHRVGPEGGFLACGHLSCGAGLHLVLRCSQCGRAQEQGVPARMMSPVRRYLQATARFQLSDDFLQVDGMCAVCAARAAVRRGR